MPQFITNIQLQDASEQDYAVLGEELKKESFITEINAAKSQAYIAGKAVFSKAGNITLQDVEKALLDAASKTGKKFSFFIVKNKNIQAANAAA